MSLVKNFERKCCVPQCHSKISENTIFHKFPNDTNREKDWIRACNITTEITSDTLICGSHFTKDDYQSDPNSGLYDLKPSAVPIQNIFENFEEIKIETNTQMSQNQDRRKCCVPQCNVRSDEKRSYHQFPRQENIKQQWMQACGIQFISHPYACVCSAHFERSDFITGPTSKKQVLKNAAVPKLNLPKNSTMKLIKPVEIVKNEQKLVTNTNKLDEKVTTIIYVPQNSTTIANLSQGDLKNSKIVVTKQGNLNVDNKIFSKVQNNRTNQSNSDIRIPRKVSLGEKVRLVKTSDTSLKRKITDMQESNKSNKSIKTIQGKVICKQDNVNNIVANQSKTNDNSHQRYNPQVNKVQCILNQKAVLKEGVSAVTLCVNCGQYCKIKEEDLLYKSYKNLETLAAELLLELQEVDLSNEDECILLTKIGIKICNNAIKRQNINLMELLTNDNELMAFTGINFELLEKLTKLVFNIEGMGPSKFKIPTKYRIVICLCKLRINLSFACLAMLFGIDQQVCANSFFSMLKMLSALLEKTIHWPKTEELLKNLPECFQSFKQTRVILSCSETQIEKQRCINCQQKMINNRIQKDEVIKLVLGVAPSGLIIFKSSVFESHSPDISVFTQTNILEKLDPVREAIMVDKSLNIETECAEHNVTLIKLPKLGKNKQFTNHDVELIKNISSARIHVDRTLHRFKMYKIMQSKVHWRILPYLDEVCTVIAGIVNMKNPIPPKEIDIK